jgi:hypothetical protein
MTASEASRSELGRLQPKSDRSSGFDPWYLAQSRYFRGKRFRTTGVIRVERHCQFAQSGPNQRHALASMPQSQDFSDLPHRCSLGGHRTFLLAKAKRPACEIRSPTARAPIPRKWGWPTSIRMGGRIASEQVNCFFRRGTPPRGQGENCRDQANPPAKRPRHESVTSFSTSGARLVVRLCGFTDAFELQVGGQLHKVHRGMGHLELKLV